jgi:hypothetical protein
MVLVYESSPSPASPTGLHVVRMGYGSHGRGHISYLSSAETSVLIHTEFQTDDYVVQTKRSAKLVGIGFTGAASHVSEIYSYRFSVFCVPFFFFLLFRQLTYRPQFATDFDV